MSANADLKLRLTEIFISLQGESTRMGLPTVFVRLTGCPLRCQYCDTAYAFSGGQLHPLADVLAQVASYGVRHVCVTGGEPLAQAACVDLLRALCAAGYHVSLETSGAMDIAAVDARVMIVLDLKTPASRECEKNRYENLPLLKPGDQIKFVICNREDYDWACAQLHERGLDKMCEVLFSPSATELSATQLADWIVADKLPARFQVQLHKILWGNVAGK